MGLYLSIPVLPGVRIGGRLTPRRRRRRPVRRRRGVGPLAFLFIAVGYTLAAEVVLALLAAAVGLAVLWLLFILARFAVLTVLNQPVQTPRDAIRQMNGRVKAWRARR